MTDTKLTPLIGMTLDRLRDVVAEVGLRPFAAKQMARWLYEKRVTSVDEMTDLPKQARALISKKYAVRREPPLTSVTSVDGTSKYLFEAVPGHPVEAVYIPDRDRATLCVSSQAGCKMNCSFCMTGRGGFHGNLTAAQIINQILSVPGSESLTNIVFMGMGEPLDNLGAVTDVIEIMTAPWGMAWSPKRITVSTIGKLDTLRTLLDTTKVHVAISVHSPYSDERRGLMPVEGVWPVTEVVDMLSRYDFSRQRRLSVEYIMWRGVNDDARHADALVRLLRPLDCRVNLIRYHAAGADDPMQPPSTDTMVRFRDRLNDAGITATIRTSRGEDIEAACGMLAGKNRTVQEP